MKWILSSLVWVMALILAGCSNHPPSAAQFMNIKEGTNFGVGASGRVGSVYDSSYVYDVNDNASKSLEEGYWNLELSLYNQISYFVMGFDLENYTPRLVLGARTNYWGALFWVGFVYAAFEQDKPQRKTYPLGFMLVEQLSISENLKVGISEHISRNTYQITDNPGCCSVNDVYGDVYGEFGAGAYVAYGPLSAEFRYGREIGASNNRFYFQLNYAFFLKGWNYSK